MVTDGAPYDYRSNYRDLRWTEREEMVRQVSEVKLVTRKLKTLMRKSGLKLRRKA